MKSTTQMPVTSFLATAAALSQADAQPAWVAKPDWLEVKGPITPANAFSVTAGVVKAARQLIDAIGAAQRRHEVLSEQIAKLESRNVAGLPPSDGVSETPTQRARNNANRYSAPRNGGFNPDGTEYGEHLESLETELAVVEQRLETGHAMLGELLEWVEANAEPLELAVEIGLTVRRDILGNEFSVPNMRALSADTLLLGIERQREFIRAQRIARLK
jgi:hypothetical protein